MTFINPIGGYGFGHVGAEFVSQKMKPGGKVLALRILPGVDVLETRWSAAKVAFDKAKVDVVGVEFTDGDPAKTKKIVDDYIQRYGTIDGVWMDAGAVAVAAVEAFQDAGKPVPPINGEDQLDFLKLWKDKKLTAIAPTYPTYQWRTPIIAALQILDGQQVSSPWKLPQPTDHPGQPGPVPRPEHAAAALRDVRLHRPARLPAALEVGPRVRHRCQPLGVGLAGRRQGPRRADPPDRRLGLRRGRAADRAARRLGPGRTRDLLAAHGLGGGRRLRGHPARARPGGRAARPWWSRRWRISRAACAARRPSALRASAGRSTPRSAGPGGCPRRPARPATRISAGRSRRSPSTPASRASASAWRR